MSRLFIVDDEKDIRAMIGDILKDEGYAIRLAGNSDDCMAEIKSELPSLMILDIWLKDSRLDGIDILKKVKRDNPDVPVVIISGHGNIEIAVAAIKQGAYEFIEKPFTIDQLMVVVARAMCAAWRLWSEVGPAGGAGGVCGASPACGRWAGPGTGWPRGPFRGWRSRGLRRGLRSRGGVRRPIPHRRPARA